MSRGHWLVLFTSESLIGSSVAVRHTSFDFLSLDGLYIDT